MKNTKIYLLPLLILTLILSACATAPQESVQPVTTGGEQVVDEVSSTAEISLSRYGDQMSCDLLADQEAQRFCLASVNDIIGMTLERDILDNFDASRCQVFPEETARECQRRIEETGVKGPLSAEEKMLFNQAMQPVFPEPTEDGEMSFELSYLPEKCAELKTEGLSAYCEKMIAERVEQQIMSEIFASGDLSRCDELSVASLNEQCRMMLGGMPAELPIEMPADQAVADNTETMEVLELPVLSAEDEAPVE